MGIERITEEFLARARMIKEIGVRRAGGQPDDIHPIVDVFRGGMPVAELTLRRHDRDEILAVARFAASGYDADVLAIAFEGYQAIGSFIRSANINPVTGQDWQAGELSNVARHHDGVAKGWLRECVNIAVVNRAGDAAAGFQAYRYVDGSVSWYPPITTSTLGGKIRATGSMQATLLDAMENPSAGQLAPAVTAGLSQARRDVLSTRFIAERHQLFAVLVAHEDDTERIRELDEAEVRYVVLQNAG